MGRKVELVTIASDDRDSGKVFQITEMPASKAEKWAMRALFALSRSGVDVPDDVANAGLAGLAAIGFKALEGINFHDAEPLLDEMFECIMLMPDASKPQVVRKLVEDDIEEIATRLKLRKAVVSLHIDFFTVAAQYQQHR